MKSHTQKNKQTKVMAVDAETRRKIEEQVKLYDAAKDAVITRI